MIQEFLQLENAIRARAIKVGRLIQEARHYAYTSASARSGVPVATPYILRCDESHVDLALAFTDRGIANVQVPVVLFDGAPDADIASWVMQQNTLALSGTAIHVDKGDQDAKRASELAILRELRAKYPDAE